MNFNLFNWFTGYLIYHPWVNVVGERSINEQFHLAMEHQEPVKCLTGLRIGVSRDEPYLAPSANQHDFNHVIYRAMCHDS